MGPTGSGKSTLLHLLARFEDPDNGQISLGGCSLKALTEADLRRTICIVNQGAHIFNGTLRDNLVLVKPHAETDEILAAIAAVRLEGFVDGLTDGLDTWVGEAGRLLSGGQAKRLAVARAVLSEAPIWALDEPTEGLDEETAEAMMANLVKEAAGRTLIMITHRLDVLGQLDQIILLDQGRIVGTGSPETLHRHSAFYRNLINAEKS
jgi:ATP-binding cassette subfamily C protein CydC